MAVNGGMPTETLVETGKAYYGERTVTYRRVYEARGADCQIDKLIRVPFDTVVSMGDYVVLEDDAQYRVDIVSEVIVRRDVRALELTLIKLEDNYNVEFTKQTSIHWESV